MKQMRAGLPLRAAVATPAVAAAVKPALLATAKPVVLAAASAILLAVTLPHTASAAEFSPPSRVTEVIVYRGMYAAVSGPRYGGVRGGVHAPGNPAPGRDS